MYRLVLCVLLAAQKAGVLGKVDLREAFLASAARRMIACYEVSQNQLPSYHQRGAAY